MGIFRTHKNVHYSTISNLFLKRTDLSWKAKGILAYLLTLPNDWELHLQELEKHATDGEASLRSGIDELKEAGYIVYHKEKNDKGQFEHWYDVYEKPVNQNPAKPDPEKPNLENLNLENLNLENQDLLNTNTLNTNKLNTNNKLNTSKYKDINANKLNTSIYKDIVEYLNSKTGSRYKHTTKKTRRLIRARWNEGFRKNDFFTVIDKKTAEWINDPKMAKYLRPETLFGTKFESYLNQPAPKGKSKADKVKERYLKAIEKDKDGGTSVL